MDKALIQKLNKVFDKINRHGVFSVNGSVPAISPGLEVEGFGPVKLPLPMTKAKLLRRHFEQAAYGKGTATLVDRTVRNVWRLPPSKFNLTNPAWDEFIEQILTKVQQELGLHDQELNAHLYDLLLYERGGFFLPHKDGEKVNRMVATLVIVLPTAHRGGELIVRHDGNVTKIDFAPQSSAANLIQYTAFYADCEHEVKNIDHGCRLCLVYNLALVKPPKKQAAATSTDQLENFIAGLAAWPKKPSERKLLITLKHQYTEKGLAWTGATSSRT